MSETSMNINNEGTATTTERSDDVVLSVKHVGKYFRLPTEQATGLSRRLLIGLKALRAIKNNMFFMTSTLMYTVVTFSVSSAVMVPENPRY